MNNGAFIGDFLATVISGSSGVTESRSLRVKVINEHFPVEEVTSDCNKKTETTAKAPKLACTRLTSLISLYGGGLWNALL